MKKKLSLSMETLRVLDDDDLIRVVGGGGDKHDGKNGHGPSGANKHCPGSRGSGVAKGCASKSGASCN